MPRHLLAAAAVVTPFAAPAAGQLLAFPGAEGAGRFATGGRGGDVYVVTNLNDAGPGSLREGIRTASGPRTIIFGVSGTIHLQSDLNINKPNLTIAGQTAPGGGITIADRQTVISNTSNIILQHVRFRVGNTYTAQVDSNYEPDALWVAGSSNVMIDHVSTSWGVDEVLSVTHGSTNVTVQWSTVTEALHNAGHSKGNHGYGSLINGGDITFHHNLYANNRSRNPRPGASSVAGQTTRLDLVNNVLYNPGDRYGYSGGDDEQLRLNFVGNYGIDGPNTTAGSMFHGGGVGSWIYAADNVHDANDNRYLDGVATSGLSGSYTSMAHRFDLPAVQTTDARQAYIQVLSRVGANVARDPVDRRIVRQVMNQAAGGDFHLDSQNEVGGWPTLTSLPPPLDSNSDGIPDYFAQASGFSPSANIRNQVGPNGYTWMEHYLHSLTPTAYSPAITEPVVVSTATGRGADAQVNENGGSAATSSGSSTAPDLKVRYVGAAGNRNEYTLLRFDLSQMAPGSVADARLELTAFRDMPGTQQIRVYGLEHDAAGWDWNEQTITFANAPALEFDGNSGTRGLSEASVLLLGMFDATGADAGEVVTFDNPNLAVFLNLAAYFGDEQGGVVTLLLERINSDNTAQARFASAEAVTLADGFNPLGATAPGAYAPRLVLDAVAVPEPGCGLSALGGAGLLASRRRRV